MLGNVTVYKHMVCILMLTVHHTRFHMSSYYIELYMRHERYTYIWFFFLILSLMHIQLHTHVLVFPFLKKNVIYNYVFGFWKTKQNVTLRRSILRILLLQLIATLLHYLCTFPLTATVYCSVYLE